MSPLLNKLKIFANTLHQSDGHENGTTKYTRTERSYERRTVKSTAFPAACRGLYAVPTKQKRNTYSDNTKQLHRVQEREDPSMSVIKRSMYPQINGKRRSEVNADFRARTTKYDLAPAGEDHSGCTTRFDPPVHPKHAPRRVRQRPQPVKSKFMFDSDSDDSSDTDSNYSSGGNWDGRPVRVCIYPQARYIKEPVNTLLKPDGGRVGQTVKHFTLHTRPYRYWKRDNLPHDEFKRLRRLQTMHRARDVLEPHYFHRNTKPKKGLIGHGETQCFAECHTTRYQASRVQYAVRKAIQVNLNQYSPEFCHAVARRVQNERFCELSDVDGVPVKDELMMGFLNAYSKFRNEMYVIKEPKLAMVRPGELAQRSSINDSVGQAQQKSRYRIDSGASVCALDQRPVLTSQFDSDSSDDELETPKRSTKKKGKK